MAIDAMNLSARELVFRIGRGELSAEDCAAAALERYDAERALNALTWIDEARVLTAAREIDTRRARGESPGSLAGLPFVVKDNIDVAGAPTAAGTPALRDNIPDRNAPVVGRMLAQGAVFLGKANMHELALGATSSNPATGSVRNPRDPTRVAGGSSGGTAAAIAAGIVPAGLGSDTAGSVRIPAAFCGTAALRPTTCGGKSYSDDGLVPLARALDTVGPMARTVADLALLHHVITGEDEARTVALHGLRLGVPRRRYWEHLDRGVESVAADALARLRAAGVALVEVNAGAYYALASEVYGSVLMHGLAEDPAAWLAGAGYSFEAVLACVASADVRAMFERAERANVPGAQVEKARRVVRERIVPAYRGLFRAHGIEALVFPTAPVVAPLLREDGDRLEDVLEIEGRAYRKVLTLIRNTHVTGVIGAPGISLPAGLTAEGLPVGLELDGLPGGDAALLGVAIAVESVLGTLPPRVTRGAG